MPYWMDHYFLDSIGKEPTSLSVQLSVDAIGHCKKGRRVKGLVLPEIYLYLP